jgi:hypothetical protein
MAAVTGPCMLGIQRLASIMHLAVRLSVGCRLESLTANLDLGFCGEDGEAWLNVVELL